MEKVVCMNLNCRSINNKIGTVQLLVLQEKVDILALTETWLTEDDPHANQFCLEGYVFQHKPRIKKRGGGVGILCKQNCFIRRKEVFNYNYFECICAIIQVNGKNISFYVLYRPYKKQEFYDEFEHFIVNYVIADELVLITGDMNAHFEDENDLDVRHINNILYAYGLKQWVNESSHIGGHTLDFIITYEESPIFDDYQIMDPGLSDHFALVFCIMQSKSCDVSNITVNDYTAFKGAQFKEHIHTLNIYPMPSNTDEFLNSIYQILKDLASIFTKKKTNKTCG